jgi:hypothetical protein
MKQGRFEIGALSTDIQWMAARFNAQLAPVSGSRQPGALFFGSADRVAGLSPRPAYNTAKAELGRGAATKRQRFRMSKPEINIPAQT